MALKPFNSVAGFSVGEVPALNIILANGDITASNATLTGNLLISNANASWGVLTDNLFYSNGVPWDLQEAAGSNNQIQFNSDSNFAASANFTFDPATNLLTVSGNIDVANADLGNLVIANYANISNDLVVQGNIANANNISITNALSASTGNFSGNITSLNADLGNLATANFVNVASNITTSNLTVNLELAGNTANFTGNLVAGNLNATGVTASTLTSNVTTGTAPLTVASTTKVTNLNADLLDGYDTSTSATANTVAVRNADGNLTANYFIGNGSQLTGIDATSIQNGNSNVKVAANGNVSISVTGISNVVVVTDTGMNVAGYITSTGNVTAANADLGNLVTANFINVSSNIVSNNITVNLELAGNTANFTGNVIAGNFIGALANGNSNVTVYSNSNVEISINGTANIATFTGNSLLVVGNINSTAGNMLANGNVSANGFLVGANAQVTGEANLSSVLTSNITANGNLTITASGSNVNINLVPGGPNGVIEASLARIAQVGGPTQPNDAATKEYVDNTSVGLTIHLPVVVTSTTNLNATYANGGSILTTIAITGGTTIQFGAAHGLSIGDELAWDNSFNNIVGNDPYFVFSTPAADTITVKAGYFGAQVTTLTNGTGLSQTARANTGVGATLTNAGANAAIQIDSVSLSSTNRVLVQGQTNQFENGVYTVTTVGNGSTAWVLTRAPEEDTYSPKSTTGMGYGDYFFVQQGTNNAGSSYTLTSPVYEILFGLTNIEYSQFSAAGTYTAGNGIAINGTIISANVDNDTTAIVSGNITVKVGANLVTPNLGDATFSSLSWNTLSNGNVSANNLSIGNIANIGANLTVAGNVQVTYDIDSNANIYSNNSDVTNFLTVGANITGNNITSNNLITTVNANISSNLVTSNATINLELFGNTANFSGNVILPNLTVNLALLGNTANFSGNIVAANANLGNLATANFFTGVLINGTSNVTVNNNANINLTAGANTTAVITATGANITGYANITGNVSANNLSLTNNISANIANIATKIDLGNTDIGWGTATTTSISANQTISTFEVTAVTGLEFLVKGIDSSGSKYSVSTVQAVTDGTNVDFTTFATVNLGGLTGILSVNIVGSNIALQVTPTSANSTVWTAQYRTI